MAELSLNQVVSEQDFIPLLSAECESFFRFGQKLVREVSPWSKRTLFQLYTEADELESFLDDYGARTNQTYTVLTELVASIRGFAMAGISLQHLVQRLDGYGVIDRLPEEQRTGTRDDLMSGRAYVKEVLTALLRGAAAEARDQKVTVPDDPEQAPAPHADAVRTRLPQDLGVEEIEDEEPRIAEVCSKYLQACAMLQEADLRPMDDPDARARLLKEHCSEEAARVYEATVHNLQSAYDTYIKNTVIEARDERLAQLRGHVSATLHLLEAVTQLTHFVERHESDVRDAAARRRLADLVPREEVHRVTLNLLLHRAVQFLEGGRDLAEGLLPTYTNVQALEVVLDDDVVVHARPASLIVAIVNHHGTPVELELNGEVCNAGSILEMMVLVGSHPEARKFLFRGDEHPLRDIGSLFESGLGERGLESLPGSLNYLRGG